MEKLITCIVIDDEPIGREIVKGFVGKIPFLQMLKSFDEPLEALQFLQENEVDIIFSDIQMPNINGMELVRSLHHSPMVVFITAHRDFALDGFDTGVVDYLVKPVRFDRFLKAVNRAKEFLTLKYQATSVHQINNDRIFIKSDGKLIKIMLDEILYVEAQGDYLKFVLTNDAYTTYTTLKSMEDVLKLPKFFRVQRSFILNLESVRSINGNMVELVNGKTISIALNKKEELYQLLGIRG